MSVINSVEEVESGKFYVDSSNRYFIYTTYYKEGVIFKNAIAFRDIVTEISAERAFEEASDFTEIKSDNLPMWVKVSMWHAMDGDKLFTCEEADNAKRRFFDQLNKFPAERIKAYQKKLYDEMYSIVSGSYDGIAVDFRLDVDSQLDFCHKVTDYHRLIKLVLACADYQYAVTARFCTDMKSTHTTEYDAKCIAYTAAILGAVNHDEDDADSRPWWVTASYYARNCDLDDLDIFPDLKFDKVPELTDLKKISF